jgi:hypothetical protein
MTLKKSKIVISLFAVCIALILMQFIPVCEVIYTENTDEVYQEMINRYSNKEISVIDRQVSTEGSNYHILNSTNKRLTEDFGDVCIVNWIDPESVFVRTDGSVTDNVKLLVVSRKVNSVKKFTYNDIKYSVIFPQRVIMLTDSEKMYESSMADRFYVKDLNILNRIRFYLGLVIPFLRCTW